MLVKEPDLGKPRSFINVITFELNPWNLSIYWELKIDVSNLFEKLASLVILEDEFHICYPLKGFMMKWVFDTFKSMIFDLLIVIDAKVLRKLIDLRIVLLSFDHLSLVDLSIEIKNFFILRKFLKLFESGNVEI